MAEPIEYEVRDGVALLRLQNPPLNALDPALRAALMAALKRAGEDAEVTAIVLAGDGAGFSAGVDMAELAGAQAAPDLRALCLAIETGGKPVVAALHGTALGGGFELALAAHARVAREDARVGLPEVALGLVPSGGATQRLARLGGAKAALDVLLAGVPLSAGSDTARAFLDELVSGDPVEAAVARARALAGSGGLVRASESVAGFRDPMAFQAEIAARRAEWNGREEIAQPEIVRCVEAAQLLPFEAGLEFEAEVAETCRTSRQSAALRHLYVAERRIAQFPGLRGAQPRPIPSAAIVGGGALAPEFAVICLDAGLEVVLHGRDDAAAADLVAEVAEIYDRAVAAGRLDEAARDERMGRLHGVSRLDTAAEAVLILETTGADADSRAVLLERLAAMAPEEAILLTTGACGAIEAIGRDSGAAERVLGLRLLVPAHVVRLAEVVPGPTTDPGVTASVVALLRRLGRVPLWSAPRDMPLGAEMQMALQFAVLTLADRGVHPYRIDAALRDWGLRGGVLEGMDSDGLRLVKARMARDGLPGSGVLEAMLTVGREGRYRGGGFLGYGEDGTPEPVDDVTDVLAEIRPDVELDDGSIVQLCLVALANRGARLVRTRQVQRPSDLDVAMVYGHGFPRLKGGPMKAADLRGLFAVQKELAAFAEDAGEAWRPDPLIPDLVKNGRTFDSLN